MLTCTLILLFLAAPGQHAAHDAGASVMGFDQEKTTHHFYLHDGGAVVRVKDGEDSTDRDAIWTHLPISPSCSGTVNSRRRC